MWQRVGGEVGHRSACLLHHIVCGAGAGGNALIGDVGHAQKYVPDFCLAARYLIGKGFLLGFERGHQGLDFLGLFLAAALHEFADFGGVAVELSGGIVALQLCLTAFIVQGKHLFDSLFAVETLDGQTLHNELGILFYLLQCKHFSLFFSFLIFALPLRVAGPIVGEEMIPAVVE